MEASKSKKKTWALLALFIVMGIGITNICQTEAVEETTYTVIYFNIPSNIATILIKTTDAYAGEEIMILAQMRVNQSYDANNFTLNLSLPGNFSLVDGDVSQLNPKLFADQDFIAVWSVKVPNSSGNYSLEVRGDLAYGNRTVQVTDMPIKTDTWLNRNSDSLLAAGIMLTILIIAGIFAYLFINLGGKKDEI